jgi:hypothetical protein
MRCVHFIPAGPGKLNSSGDGLGEGETSSMPG